jgi:hypothetical protein
MSNKFWFKPKHYGYGATPVTWEGWALIAAFVVAVFGSTLWLIGPGMTALAWALWAAVVAVATAAMITFTKYKTDGDWRWRWSARNNSGNVR